VSVPASAATRAAALEAGFEVIGYRRATDPNVDVAFEQHAARLMGKDMDAILTLGPAMSAS
jgi:hypothetical protein